MFSHDFNFGSISSPEAISEPEDSGYEIVGERVDREVDRKNMLMRNGAIR